MISINFNPAVLLTQRSINQSNLFINQALERLSTGFRINSPSDDPAGFYVGSRLNSEMRSLAVVQQNVASGISFMQTASGSLNQMNNILNRLNDLALQASSDSLDADSRSAAQRETNELLSELFRLRDESKFNGKNVFGVNTARSFSLRSVSSLRASVLANSTPPPKLVCRS